jgi:hypothetical protein
MATYEDDYIFLGTFFPKNDGKIIRTVDFFGGFALKISASEKYSKGLKNFCFFRIRYFDPSAFSPRSNVFFSKWIKYYPDTDVVLYRVFYPQFAALSKTVELCKFTYGLPTEPLTYSVTLEAKLS